LRSVEKAFGEAQLAEMTRTSLPWLRLFRAARASETTGGGAGTPASSACLPPGTAQFQKRNPVAPTLQAQAPERALLNEACIADTPRLSINSMLIKLEIWIEHYDKHYSHCRPWRISIPRAPHRNASTLKSRCGDVAKHWFRSWQRIQSVHLRLSSGLSPSALRARTGVG